MTCSPNDLLNDFLNNLKDDFSLKSLGGLTIGGIIDIGTYLAELQAQRYGVPIKFFTYVRTGEGFAVSIGFDPSFGTLFGFGTTLALGALGVPFTITGVAATIALSSVASAIGNAIQDEHCLDDLLDMLWPALARIFGDPLVLDLNGDGVHLIGLDGSHVNFDFGADGFRERTGWASAGDGFLARDLDGNGKIESLSEMFGTTTQDAFTMLRGFDIDGDGKITSADAVWSTLKVWQDANSNGITDAGELKTLADLGITEIGLGNTAVDRRVDGNYIHSAASFVMKGQTNEAQAVFFGMAPNIAIFTPPAGFVPNAEAANLPQLAGGGATPSLSRACTPQRKLGVGNRLAA